MKSTIATEKAPAAIGPYSQGIVCSGETVYVSGQTPINPATGAIEESTISGQAEQALENVGAVLAAAGLSYENVVKTTCFITDMSNFAEFNKVYGEYFRNNCPARSCVEVNKLPKDSLCEIEVIAIK